MNGHPNFQGNTTPQTFSNTQQFIIPQVAPYQPIIHTQTQMGYSSSNPFANFAVQHSITEQPPQLFPTVTPTPTSGYNPTPTSGYNPTPTNDMLFDPFLPFPSVAPAPIPIFPPELKQPAPPVPVRRVNANTPVQGPPLPQRNPTFDVGINVSPPTMVHKHPITVIVSEKLVILLNNHMKNESLVIEKKNGHPGSFIPYDPDIHTVNAANIEVEAVIGIITYESESFLILIPGKEVVATIEGDEICKISRVRFVSFKERNISQPDAKPLYSVVEKFITSGLFYYSRKFHLTQSLQRQSETGEDTKNKPMWKMADKRFFWNYYLSRHFIRKGLHSWVVPVIRGFVGQEKGLPIIDSRHTLDLTLISRISWLKAGTRYNARGVNDDGNVANFVETEQIVTVGGNIISFVEIRGTVPVFWQQRFITGKYKLEITRTSEATFPAFQKHFDEQHKIYKKVHIVNLLSGKGKESKVTEAFEKAVKNYKGLLDCYTHWDFKKECGNSHFENVSRLISSQPYMLKDKIDYCGFFLRNYEGKVVQKQNGTFRVNCLDCLDRTNVIMSSIAQHSLVQQLKAIGIKDFHFSDINRMGLQFKNMWANNGDNLSTAYTGTGAMKSGYTRSGKRTIAGMLDDAAKSAKRAYINNFMDADRQEAIDTFLGNIESIVDEEFLAEEDVWVRKQLEFRRNEYSEIKKYRIYVGSWNTNGIPPSENAVLYDWISPEYPSRREFNHDSVAIYIFGFQEIVKLSANSIYKADETNMENWMKKLANNINSKRSKKVVLANSIQLVGLAILVFIQEDLTGHLRNFTIEKTKTAVQGLAGNKGALCCRFDFMDTAICCVCAHLTAGHNKIMERIKDVRDIFESTRFPNMLRHSKIEGHDYILWFGDLNFRIELPYQESLSMVTHGELETLLEYDQLNILQNKSTVDQRLLPGFIEPPVKFKPTYKYDLGSEKYDTSELMRAPAWCDRILYKAESGLNIKQLDYSRAELYYSDHRPIKSLFDIDIMIIDQKKKEKLEKGLYKIAQTLDKIVLTSLEKPYIITEDLLGPLDTDTVKVTVVGPLPKYPEPSDLLGKEKSRYNKFQECLLDYRTSIICTRDKLVSCIGQSEVIMACTNLFAQINRAILNFMVELSGKERTVELALQIFEQAKNLTTVSTRVIQNISDKTVFDELVKLFDTVVHLIDIYLPEIK